ncbi:XylR family transcriptional regulator [Blastopirellula marina]|uniref:XylR family transcriptional regulator n=1 Tax=Blastopirellula marina TaxID=124 RepID=A0A2S8FSJ7_9BACT|nr:xylose operon transcription regulator XylR [Blastopirellula marina]PQO35148.1 XylR family transcriptional regulator [Blastopirellula marina]PQO47938.1 XylR family transcriptional regulator [Blastopirellula marina]PTL43897.1 xylose operon transcription regulator XylR [Blastopirellula marina]
MRSPAAAPHVALLIETSRTYGRELLHGVRQYVAEHGPWSLLVESRSLETPPPPWLPAWQGSGILTRSGSQKMADAVARAKLPTVELRSTRLKHNFPFIGVDNRSLGKLVAEHFLSRGFRNFAVYQLGAEEYFQQRCENFVQTVAEHGFAASRYHPRNRREQPTEWEQAQQELTDWVNQLPKPVGVMACTDQLGFWLLDACRRCGAIVPEEVAVVGVENDASLCSMASTPLSSVELNGAAIGYRAAELLNHLMRGGKPPQDPILVQPLGIVTRQSSDIVAIDDPELAAAILYMRENACDGASVSDVLRAVAISRSSLERGLRKLLGRSPNQELLRLKLNRAEELLTHTDLTLTAIAERCGFRRTQHLAESFRELYGMPPGQYRRERRKA